MSAQHVAVVRNHLQGLAKRGVLRGFHERPARTGKVTFEFEWLFDTPFLLEMDDTAGTLKFKDLLPNLSARAPEYAGVKDFIEGKSNPKLRPHRRVDPKRAELFCSSRAGHTSITLKVHRNQYAYGIRTLLNTVNELFGFLHLHCVEYLTVTFDLPEE